MRFSAAGLKEYEVLRCHMLDSSIGPHEAFSRAFLIARGLAAWLRGWETNLPSDQGNAAQTSPKTVGVSEASKDLVRMVAEMVWKQLREAEA